MPTARSVLLPLLYALCAGPASAQGRAPVPAAPAKKKPAAEIRLPANAPPVITTTSSVPEYRRAEVQLARFIRALQQGERRRAVRFLSRRVSDRERQALVENRWLSREGNHRNDFGRLLYLPDIRIRTMGIYRDTLKLNVAPRVYGEKKAAFTGYLEVTMRRERGQWRVELHPDFRV